MKRNILILLTLWIFTSTSCLYKNSIAYPGINIYKTNADYFNNVSVFMSDGEITGRPSVRMPILSGTDTIFFHRYKLNNNYIATGNSWFEREVFLDLTYTDYIELQNQMGGTFMKIHYTNIFLIRIRSQFSTVRLLRANNF